MSKIVDYLQNLQHISQFNTTYIPTLFSFKILYRLSIMKANLNAWQSGCL